ncbi:hypothetical protein HAX54_052188, partial [Datura stramonium]|nr:hypothetical protein [Datura stramonium]
MDADESTMTDNDRKTRLEVDSGPGGWRGIDERTRVESREERTMGSWGNGGDIGTSRGGRSAEASRRDTA